MVHLVQISNGSNQRVALVEEPKLHCLEGVQSIYELADESLRKGRSLSICATEKATGEVLDYDAVYENSSQWRLICPINLPGEQSRILVAGTGLTHIGSANDRQAMHAAENPAEAATMTDSMRMFQWGVEKGRPAKGGIGVAPEWFYKGNGSVLKGPFEALHVPAYAEDGGEEAEIAGIYLIGEDGTPYRLGMAIGNEFSDHKFERRNYLNLAGSKLRNCSLGPELVVGAQFDSINGEARIERDGKVIWEKKLETGEQHMSHSLANLEHHHFKFEGHRQPGSLHVHYFGAYALSFGDGVELRDGDWMNIHYNGFGRSLRNPICVESASNNLQVAVRDLS